MRLMVCKVQLKIRKEEIGKCLSGSFSLVLSVLWLMLHRHRNEIGMLSCHRIVREQVISLGLDAEKFQSWLPSYATCVLECGLCEEDVLVGILKNVWGYVGFGAISGA
jgi:hypothetical protein